MEKNERNKGIVNQKNNWIYSMIAIKLILK